MEDEDDEDVNVLSKVEDVVHAVFSQYKDTWLPQFEILLPQFSKLLEPTRPWSDLQ